MANEHQRTHILLIEDHAPDVFLVKEALKTRGITCELTHVRDGEEARSYLWGVASVDVAPDLIVLDLNLPKLEGLELLKIIRGRPCLAYTPVMVLTSSREPNDQDRAHRQGANAYITKPVGFHEFVRAVGNAAKQLLTARSS
jgi:CheY-like chemotaxis protein